MQEHTYSIKGMHCAACEVLIEKKLLEIPGIKAVDASTAQGKATIEYEGQQPSAQTLNEIFIKDNYVFFEGQPLKSGAGTGTVKPSLVGLSIALAIAATFLLLDRSGISGLLSITSSSSLPAFFGFGLLAGLSSCAALIGGVVLSLSKQWNELYSPADSSAAKLQPHLMFNAGRVASYALFGGLLGLIGSRLTLSFTATAWLIISISLLMIALGLQMLDVGPFKKFQIALPKFITRGIANEKKFQGKYMPLAMGAATFFLPCGFTITAQTVALLSASATQGALILGLFALGTAPILLIIGLSSVKFLSRPHLAMAFSKTAGFLIVFFALYNLYNQASILGIIK